MSEIGICRVCQGRPAFKSMSGLQDRADPTSFASVAWIECDNCGAKTEKFSLNEREKAVTAWNADNPLPEPPPPPPLPPGFIP